VQPAGKGYTDSNPPDTTYWREEQVPQFLDHHPTTHATLTEEAVEELRKHIRAETPDDFGVKWLSIYVAVNGEGYCLSEAPNAEAVVKSHELMGYLIETTDVIEVASLI
jgi:Protein of unknown function (DUF4242)